MEDLMNEKMYYHKGLFYEKKCFNCVVEWLDDQCSLEQDRCDSCLVNAIYTKWEIDKWRLDNNQLHPIKDTEERSTINTTDRKHIWEQFKAMESKLKQRSFIS